MRPPGGRQTQGGILARKGWRELHRAAAIRTQAGKFDIIRGVKGIARMKNHILILAVALLTLEAGAITGRRSYGYKPGSDAKYIDEGGASEVKAKNAAEKQARAKAKGIVAEKLVLPEGATCSGMTIDLEGRIESLCGFEIGDIAKLSRHPALDKEGNIVVTGKLPKPFRK